MRHSSKFFVLGLPLVLLLGCTEGPKVLQGKVVSYDAAAKSVTLEDELPPHAKIAVDVASAAMGAPPTVGGVVRVAYHDRGDRLVAGRVMNVGAKLK